MTSMETWYDILGNLRLYVDHVKSSYKNAVVVFDGYEGGPSTKDNAHLRRTGGCMY